MIETKGLRKSFQVGKGRKSTTVEAVRAVDLKVGGGEIFGFLGPNGAGKTTTLRMLTTLLEPDGGEAVIAGADLRKDPGKVRQLSGYVAQGGGTVDDATAREELVLQARMYGIDKVDAQKRAAKALEAFGLAEFADRRCRTYSGGQRRRVDIALGVIHEPKVLFLDEPTVGLDPQSRARMWDEVRRLRHDGMTVFITTHYLDEADALCDRIAIIDNGEIVAEGTPDDLKREIAGDVVRVGLNGTLPAAAELLGDRPFVRKLEIEQDKGLRLYVDDGPAAIPQIIRVLDGSDISFGGMELTRPSLDDVFLTKTGRSLRER
ncbi:MAG TPA: ATP-binding cassette domain-containing protein [Pseudonocardiaceae bacterium]|nr:ATP-binding cassette domain-containing protein [Pseudonocardiaceae bacterium]